MDDLSDKGNRFQHFVIRQRKNPGVRNEEVLQRPVPGTSATDIWAFGGAISSGQRVTSLLCLLVSSLPMPLRELCTFQCPIATKIKK
ncbi:unnamed protein product [Gadus morhua 'NCC']